MKIKTASIGFIIGLFLLGSTIIWVSSVGLSRTSQIQGIWLEFESNRSDRLRALIALRSELGYGGMIHRFKNYILRQSEIDSKTIASSLAGAKVAIEHYKSLQLNVIEQESIIRIERMLNAYQNALSEVDAMIAQGKTAKQIDDVVKINDLFALEALKVLENETKTAKNEIIDSRSRPLLLSSLRTAMGYGGLIHNFKNYILRHSPQAAAQVKSEIMLIETVVALYEKNSLSSLEENALRDILFVVHAYQKNLSIVHDMSLKGELPRTIDKVVVINDLPALEGFKKAMFALIVEKIINSLE